MSDAASLGVICDLFAVGLLALLMALPFYAYLQRRPDTLWNYEGNVLARPYGWPDGVVVLLFLTLFSPFNASHGSQEALRHAPDASSTSVVMVTTVIMLLIALMVLAWFRVVRGLNPAELFGMRQMTVRNAFFTALGAVFVTYLALIFFKWFVEDILFVGKFPDSSSQDTVQTFQKSGGMMAFRVVMGVAAVLIAPLAEEILFRGLLYGVVKRFTDRWFAAVFSSLIFAVIHQHVGSLVPLFVLAMGFTLAYEATGCLLVPIFMHALFNGLNIVLLVASSLG